MRRPFVRIVGRVVVAALVVFLALRLWQLWQRRPVDFSTVDTGVFVVAVLVSLVAVTSYGLVWLYILRRLGARRPLWWIALFFKSQLAKYVPGSAWQYAGRVALARRYGTPVPLTLASVVVEVLASAAAAGLAGVLVLPIGQALIVWAALGVAVAGVVVVGLRTRLLQALDPVLRTRLRLDSARLMRAVRALPAATVLYLVVWAAYGAAFWLTARALFAVPAAQLLAYVGAFALAWLAGFAAVFAPGGVGVREAVLVALLSGRLGEAHAIVLAGASRLVLTSVDLAAGALSVGLPLLYRRGDEAAPRPGARG